MSTISYDFHESVAVALVAESFVEFVRICARQTRVQRDPRNSSPREIFFRRGNQRPPNPAAARCA